MKYLSFMTIAPLALVLAGCGGSSSTVEEAGPNGLPYGAAGLVASKSRIEGLTGTKMTASGAIAKYNTAAFAPTVADTTATVTLNTVNQLRVVLDGTTYTLNSSNGGGSFTDGEVTAIPAYSGAIGGTQSVLFYRVADDVGTDRFNAFIFTGFETRPSEISSGLGTVTYNGGAGMQIRDSAGNETVLFDDPGNLLFVGNNGDNGAIAMTVNFASGAVSGNVTADNALGGENLDLILTGTASGGGVSGTFAENPADNHSTLDFANGTFSGRFYGPNAKDVAGSLSADVSGASITDGNNAAVGLFIGAR